MNIEVLNNLIKENASDGRITTKNISDGHHTFEELYTHRIYLFSVICNKYPNLAWKSRCHFDEENEPMYNDSFIAGISTPKGEATYHIKLKYWDLFNVKEVERAPKYDGYTSDDVLERLLSLNSIK